MVPRPTPKIHRVRAQLTATQKAQQRAHREALADDIDTAKESYEAEAADIAQKYGRRVCIINILLLIYINCLVDQ
jgi:hypothetical protein